MGKVHAPFSTNEVASLVSYQRAGMFHPFTCGRNSGHPPLLAEVTGWRCTSCGYTQDWAHDWMADWSWEGFREGG